MERVMIRESAYMRAPNGAGKGGQTGDRSGDCGDVDLRLRSLSGGTVFAQDLGGDLLAGAAVGGDAELRLQAPEVANAALRGFADLLVGNGVADTDVHGAMGSSCALN